MAYKRLGEILLSFGLLSEEQLQDALHEQEETGGKKLGTILVEKGFIRERQLYSALEYQLGIEYIDLQTQPIVRDLAGAIPRTVCERYHLIPVKLESNVLYIAMEDPLNFVAVDAVKAISRRRVVPMIASPEAVERAVSDLYGSENAERALQELQAAAGSAASPQVLNLSIANVIDADSDSAAPTIRLVNSFLEYAVNQNASDIHMEPREKELVIRMRIDGMLRQVFTVPQHTQNAVIARVKVMGSMDISEHKIPLDGRSNVRIGTKDVDLRISTMPTVYGEKVVIRLLYKNDALLSAAGIGLSGSNLSKFERLMHNSNGVILIVGPTGSGKSSTMYTMIRQLNTENVNLVTLEDPVEYNIDGINQVQINEKAGLTFAQGLRSVLRQDPDIIAVGEIRDTETAKIAMRAAVTGHLVLSTVHTNDAPSTISRLLDIGVEPYLISSALKGVISQRLVRRICPNCREEYTASEEEQRMLRLTPAAGRKFYRGTGCSMCAQTGYRGRTAVFEILVLNTEINRAIADGKPYSEIITLIRKTGYKPLIFDCISLVNQGITTVEEAYRTINSTETS